MAVDSLKDMILMYSQSYSPTALGQQEQQQADRGDESAAATWQTHQTICQENSLSLCCFACVFFFCFFFEISKVAWKRLFFDVDKLQLPIFLLALSPFHLSIMTEELMGGSKIQPSFG